MGLQKGEPSPRCTVCQHPERVRIELLIASGASRRAIGRKYKLNLHAVCNHWNKHVSEARQAALKVGPVEREALAARLSEESQSVLDHFRVVRAGLYSLFDAAVTAGDSNGGAMLAARLIRCLEAIARITGELASSPLVQQTTNNVFVLPQFATLQAALIRALQPHPEARAAVIQALRDLEARSLTASPAAPAGPAPRLIEHEPHADT